MNSRLPIPLPDWLRRHWFVPLALAVIAGDLGALRWGDWSAPDAPAWLLEAALLFDFAVLLPLLYAWCYRHGGRGTVLRSIALACFAIWATGHVLPQERHVLLEQLSWLRYLGLAGLLVLELKLMLQLYKSVVLGKASPASAQQTLQSQGMPAWAARLMALDAQLWRWVWLSLCRAGRHLRTGKSDRQRDDTP